ncbi:MAG: GNAT family N-acetyltransferase [Acidimicrobiales bacterium]
MEFRRANVQDIEAIAALHAKSWRNNYRGAYSDAFLDGNVVDDRRAVWSERLTHPSSVDDTVVAERNGSIIGFVHTILDQDPVLGALLDNLHVAHDIKRTGIGTQLMAQSASAVMARGTLKRLYLAVLEANAPAQAFYEARGGERVGQEISEAPGGGSVVGFLYAWEDPSVLLQAPTS